jgi:hypothetical protein
MQAIIISYRHLVSAFSAKSTVLWAPASKLGVQAMLVPFKLATPGVVAVAQALAKAKGA